MVKGSSGIIFTLPEGFRPPYRRRYTSTGGGAFAQIDVYTDGTVRLASGTATGYLSLSGITFRAADET